MDGFIGIDDLNLEKIEIEAKEKYLDLCSEVSSIKYNLALHTQYLRNDENLNFIFKNYKKQLKQLDAINEKNEAYYQVLLEVVNGYRAQEKSMSNDVNQYNSIPKIEEEM